MNRLLQARTTPFELVLIVSLVGILLIM